MKRNLIYWAIALGLLAAGFSARSLILPALAQQTALPVAIVVSSCGVAGTYLVNRSAPLTVTTTGKTC